MVRPCRSAEIANGDVNFRHFQTWTPCWQVEMFLSSIWWKLSMSMSEYESFFISASRIYRLCLRFCSSNSHTVLLMYLYYSMVTNNNSRETCCNLASEWLWMSSTALLTPWFVTNSLGYICYIYMFKNLFENVVRSNGFHLAAWISLANTSWSWWIEHTLNDHHISSASSPCLSSSSYFFAAAQLPTITAFNLIHRTSLTGLVWF